MICSRQVDLWPAWSTNYVPIYTVNLFGIMRGCSNFNTLVKTISVYFPYCLAVSFVNKIRIYGACRSRPAFYFMAAGWGQGLSPGRFHCQRPQDHTRLHKTKPASPGHYALEFLGRVGFSSGQACCWVDGLELSFESISGIATHLISPSRGC